MQVPDAFSSCRKDDSKTLEVAFNFIASLEDSPSNAVMLRGSTHSGYQHMNLGTETTQSA